MLRKSTLLAVAASAALGLAMLSSDLGQRQAAATVAAMAAVTECTAATAADARGHHGGGTAATSDITSPASSPALARSLSPPDLVRRSPGRTPPTAPRVVAPGPCTCLSKEYTPEGAVLFKDRCTNEAAINPPAPQQTGAIEPQSRAAVQRSERAAAVDRDRSRSKPRRVVRVRTPASRRGSFYCVLTRASTRALLSMSRREPLPERRGVVVIVVRLAGPLGGRHVDIVLCGARRRPMTAWTGSAPAFRTAPAIRRSSPGVTS